MKIALVTLDGENPKLNELGNFLADSRLTQTVFERWRLPAMDFAENALAALAAEFAQNPVDMLLFPSGWQGAEVATRLACRLGGDALSNVSHGDFTDRRSVNKPACGGAMVAEIRLQSRPWCLSVAAAPGAAVWQPDCPTVHLAANDAEPDWLVSQSTILESQSDGLAEAKFVLAAGRGVESADNMQRLEALAEQWGAEMGASREAVMHAWCGMDRLIGMSGTQVAPDICLVAGVSGAAAFASGINRSRFIVAINNDPLAPVFRLADVGIVDELMPVLEALAELATTKA